MVAYVDVDLCIDFHKKMFKTYWKRIHVNSRLFQFRKLNVLLHTKSK